MKKPLITNMAMISQSVGITYPQLAQQLTIELHQLTNYLAGVTPFPAELLTKFCSVVGSVEPFDVLLAPLGCRVISQKDELLKQATTLTSDLMALHKQKALLIEQQGRGSHE